MGTHAGEHVDEREQGNVFLKELRMPSSQVAGCDGRLDKISKASTWVDIPGCEEARFSVLRNSILTLSLNLLPIHVEQIRHRDQQRTNPAQNRQRPMYAHVFIE